MSNLFNYSAMGLFAGGRSPYSPGFESISLTALEGLLGSNLTLRYPREDMMDFAAKGQYEMITRPRVVMDLSYIFNSGINENLIGFNVGGGASALTTVNEERNYYLVVNQDNHELKGYSGYNNIVLAVGNAILNSYTLSAGVGKMTTINASMEGLNLVIQPSGSGQPLPSIYKESGTYPTGTYTLPALNFTASNYFEGGPGNIVLTFDSGCAIGTLLSGNESCPLQNFSFSVNMPRQEMRDIDWAYPNVRPVKYPIQISISADAYLNNLQNDSLNKFLCADSGLNFNVAFKSSCVDQDDFHFQFAGAKLNSQVFTQRVGGYNQVSLNWSVKVMDINRTGPFDPNFYIFPNRPRAYNSIVFPQVNYGTGILSFPLVIALNTYAYLNVIRGAAILVGNNAFVSDEPTAVTIRVSESGTSVIQDVNVNVF